MSDVTVVGLGLMGSALGRVLLENGHSVTVWNRTAARAAPLQEMGAVVPADVASAVAASPITLVCVANYDVSSQILAGIGGAVAGKVLVQLTQIEKLINSTQQVIGGNVIVEVEGVEQLLLPATLSSHHSRVSHSNILAST